MGYDSTWNLHWYMDRVTGRENTFYVISNILNQNFCRRVLDVGGGPGLISNFLHPDTKLDIVDRSPKAKFLGEPVFPNIKFMTGEIDSVEGIYDAVLSIGTIENMSNYKDFLTHAMSRSTNLVIVTIRNGLGNTDLIRFHKNQRDYWDNKYSFPDLISWVCSEFILRRIDIIRVKVERDYSPEVMLVLYKEY